MKAKFSKSEEEILERIRRATSFSSLAMALEEQPGRLQFLIYRKKTSNYVRRMIPKKGGGVRTIFSPIVPLKIVQRKIAQVLQVAERKHLNSCSHGFTPDRSILTNAIPHTRKKHVLNCDIEDFFGAIHFGRVRGLFMNHPLGFNEKVATALAQICCHQGRLPQGAPTSPVISNLICRRLDASLKTLSKSSGCFYTRYADDLTISTNQSIIPELLKVMKNDGEDSYQASLSLTNLIEKNGFALNTKKTRLQSFSKHQEVTGITVNRFPNVNRRYLRAIRAALHSCKKYGYESANDRFLNHYNKVTGRRIRKANDLGKSLKGQIEFVGFVRGKADPLYSKYLLDLHLVAPQVFGSAETKRKIRPIQPLYERARQVVWVVEADLNSYEKMRQGTAFMVSGLGLVTCAHCVSAGSTVVYNACDPEKKHDAKVVSIDAANDLALLHFEGWDRKESFSDKGHTPKIDEEVVIFGHPNFGFKDTLRMSNARVSFFRPPFIMLDKGIIEGNSGGPVLTPDGRLVGIAQKGRRQSESDHITEDYKVIPFDLLNRHIRGASEALVGAEGSGTLSVERTIQK